MKASHTRESLHLLFSTICKVQCLKFVAAIQLYEELAATS